MEYLGYSMEYLAVKWALIWSVTWRSSRAINNIECVVIRALGSIHLYVFILFYWYAITDLAVPNKVWSTASVNGNIHITYKSKYQYNYH